MCAGYGGLELAVCTVFPEAELVWLFENDPNASVILKNHHPGVPNHGDITAANWSSLESVDILTAGFPCQDISNAGKRKGIDGERSGIWKNVAEAVGCLRPRLVFLENVSAILRRGGGTVITDLAEIGYDARWITLRASDVEAPHQRNRWFCVACPSDASGLRWAQRRPEYAGPQGEVFGPAECGSASPTNTDGCGRTGHEELPSGRIAVRQRIRANVDGRNVDLPAYSDGIGRNGRPGDESKKDWRGEPAHGGNSPAEWWGDYLSAIRRWERINGTAPAPTEIGPKGGKRLTAEFAEWMMGLPAGYVTAVEGLDRSRKLKAIGNGVVPQQAAKALRLLLDIDS